MKKITLEQIQGLCQYLEGSMLPSREVKQICTLLNSLPPVEEVKNDEPKP